MKKALSIMLALGMMFSVVTVAAYAEPVPEAVSLESALPFTIGNAYANVCWDTWNQYKAQLHVHTDASDGSVPINQVIEVHYSLNYDILAITDHMVVGVPWDQIPHTTPLMRLVELNRTGMRPLRPLTSERREQITTGVGRYWPDGSPRPMLEVTHANELNGAVFRQNHVQGFFSNYGQGVLGVTLDYLRPIRGVHADGGISVINHPGDTHRARHDPDPMTFFDRYPHWIDKFAYPLLHYYQSAVGVDISSGWDQNTQFDRMFYDRLLERLIPHGVVPWSFTWSDGHQHGEFDRAWSVHLMTELTEPELRRSMEEGTLFGFSRSARFEMGEQYWRGEGDAPRVNRITVCEQDGTIDIQAELYDEIVWVSHRTREVHRGNTLNIAEHLEDDYFFVRAYLMGPGGVLFVQPFTVLRQGQVLVSQPIENPRDSSTNLNILADIGEFAKRWFLPWRLVWWTITQFDPWTMMPRLMGALGQVYHPTTPEPGTMFCPVELQFVMRNS
ncbi:MAG: hypothetical protein FWD06_01335 [Oscillospiraceae bacterium]|nr:hypothetical protein [Oscillospiraceae bacterium]